jgi:PAS domain S-box-containing protein
VYSPGLYVGITIALVGFALFAAIHHFDLWWTRRERSSLIFVACCVPAAIVCAAHAAAATVTTVEGAQLALDVRTTFGLLTHTAIAWLVASTTGVRATAYRWAVTGLLVSGALVNSFGYSIVGDIQDLDRQIMPWGEQLAVIVRKPANALFPRLLYAGIMTVQLYALVGARALWSRDRTEAALMALAGIVGLVGATLGMLIDTQVVRFPYVGQLAVAAWIALMAVMLSRSHARRGELLEASERRFRAIYDQTFQTQESLRASEASLAAVIANSPGVAIQWYDAEGRVLLWNRASEEMFGYTAEEAVGKTLDALIHTAEEFRAFLDALREIARTGQPIGPTEYTFRRRFAEPRVCSSTIFQIPPGPDGRNRFVCMDVDITERKRAEEALAVSEARFRTLIESAPEAIAVFDVECDRFVEVNQQACVMFGLSAEELKGMGPVALSPPTQPDGRESRAASMGYMAQAVAGAMPVFQWTHRTPAGRDIPCEVRLVRLPDPARTLVRGSVTDISERVRLEEQLRQSQKMEAIGQLAGGVAHDFNNLLAIISGYADLLQQHLGPVGAHAELVEAIQDASGRAASLTERLLAFSRRAVHTPQLVDLNSVVLDAEGMLRRLIGEDVQLTVRLHEGSNRVRIDPTQWSQVLLNLAINARDAMPDGGRLLITTSPLDLAASGTNHPDRPPGRYVQLSVSDTGCGMHPDLASHIFEPFFTTKPVGKGTGLGLSVVHGIVTQDGGFIDVSTAPDAGTTFKVAIPLIQEDGDHSLIRASE